MKCAMVEKGKSKHWSAPLEVAMTRLLFLLSPVLFGWLCLLLGKTFSWIRTMREDEDLTKVTVLTNSEESR